MTITVSTWNGWLKQRYAQNVLNTIPEDLVLERDFKFSTAKQIGEQYSQVSPRTLFEGVRITFRGGSFPSVGEGAA